MTCLSVVVMFYVDPHESKCDRKKEPLPLFNTCKQELCRKICMPRHVKKLIGDISIKYLMQQAKMYVR